MGGTGNLIGVESINMMDVERTRLFWMSFTVSSLPETLLNVLYSWSIFNFFMSSVR